MRPNRANAALFRLRPQKARIQIQMQVFLERALFPQDGIAHGKRMLGIARLVFQKNFFDDARFSRIFPASFAIGSANVHADFAGGIASQHRAILN